MVKGPRNEVGTFEMAGERGTQGGGSWWRGGHDLRFGKKRRLVCLCISKVGFSEVEDVSDALNGGRGVRVEDIRCTDSLPHVCTLAEEDLERREACRGLDGIVVCELSKR